MESRRLHLCLWAFFLTSSLSGSAAYALEPAPWLDDAVNDPFNAEKTVNDMIAPNLKPDTCAALPDFKRKLSFSDVVVAVLCHNPDTKSAYMSLSAQGATYATNYAGYLPKVTGTVGTSRSGAFGDHTKSSSVTHNSDMALSMTLYDFGQREMKFESAELALAAAGHTFNSTLQGTIASAMQGYYALLTAQNGLELAKETQRYAKESYDAATLRHKIGQVPLADVLQAKGGYSSQLLATMQAENGLALAQASMAQLMGQAADTELMVQEVDDKSLLKEPFADEVKMLMARAKEERHDLQASRASVKASEVNLHAQKRADFATVSATANMDVGNAQSANIFKRGNTRSQALGVSVSIPIFNGFANSYSQYAAEKSLEAQKEGLEKSELQVEQDVRNSWHNYQTAKQSWKTSQDQLDSATQLRDVALGRYKEGLGTILDVLNAQTQYSSALQSSLQSRYNVFTSRVDLVRSVGLLNLDSVHADGDSYTSASKENNVAE